MDEPDDAEEETDTEISDDDDEEEDKAGEDPPPATAPRTGARSILRFFGFGQRDPPVSLIRQHLGNLPAEAPPTGCMHGAPAPSCTSWLRTAGSSNGVLQTPMQSILILSAGACKCWHPFRGLVSDAADCVRRNKAAMPNEVQKL